jgi:hypothetical protein
VSDGVPQKYHAWAAPAEGNTLIQRFSQLAKELGVVLPGRGCDMPRTASRSAKTGLQPHLGTEHCCIVQAYNSQRCTLPYLNIHTVPTLPRSPIL